MIYIERHIAGSLNFGNVCLIRIYMVFSEYKRRLISTHIYLSNVLLTKIWDLKFVAQKPTVCPSCNLTHFCYCDIAKDSIGFI